jgi:hypothetical protein
LTANVPSTVSLGDVNGDGQLDGIFLESGTISVTLGNGEGSFQEQQHYAVGSSPASASLGDINGDEHLDLMVTNLGSDDLSVLLGNGDGSFQTQRRFDNDGSPLLARLGDVNGDDNVDAVVANLESGISVLLGNGEGSFQAQQKIISAIQPDSLTLGDVNGDDVLDIVGITQKSRHLKSLTLLLGNGDGSFQEEQNFVCKISTFFHSNDKLLLSDVNGNGRLDVVTIIDNDNHHIDDEVSVIFNRGHLK